jgi:hypothetical protein
MIKISQTVKHTISGRTGVVRDTKSGQAFVEWSQVQFGRPAESWMTVEYLVSA